jgi:hypothetical protein
LAGLDEGALDSGENGNDFHFVLEGRVNTCSPNHNRALIEFVLESGVAQ